MRRQHPRAMTLLCPVLVLAGLAIPGTFAAAAREDVSEEIKNSYKETTARDYEYPESVSIRQVEALVQFTHRVEQEMFEPPLLTQDLPTPFTSSLRSQSAYYDATGQLGPKVPDRLRQATRGGEF
ncbi:MAG: hypothetical protein H7Y22_02430 [Gemmatimonadaceae bacterium]|nr:hypothetical protein [Gloeobacterales cyanobacterium ES-bin-141]